MKHLRIVSLFLGICLTILLFPAGAAGLSDGAFYGGTAIQFGDLNNTLQYPQRIMGNTDNLTMEAWIKPTIQMLGNTSVKILYNGAGSSTYYYSGYGVGVFSQGLAVYLGGKGMLVDQTSLLNQNQWYHVALVREPKSSGGEWKLYLNGTRLVGLTRIDITTTTDPQGFNGRPEEVFTIGNNPAISDQYKGCIDEVRVWNTARTAEQIRGDMYKKLNGNEANLVAYYDFENADGFSVTPGGDNTGVTTVPNKVGASGALTLSNFTLTGSISNFVSSMEAGTFGFSSGDYDVWEDQSSVALTVTRSAPSDCAVSVGYATSDGTALAGTHYTSASGTLTFAAGQTSKTITVPVIPNSTGGEDKSFTVTLTAPDGIAVSPAAANVTVKSIHTVDIAAIPGVTAPVTGGTRTTAIAETAQYTGTVSWSPAHNPFREAIAYTATISLAPKTGYKFSGVPANFFKVAGATTANSAGSGVVTATFPYTAYATPAAGEGYSIDYANETISITSGYEVSANAAFDTLLSDGDSITGYLGTSLYVRKAANGGVPASPSTQISVAARPVTPAASFSTSAMTLSGIDASMEYSLDGGTTWTDAPGSSAVVSGVTPEEDIRVRVKATGTAPASLAQLIDILARNAAPDGLAIDYVGETLNTAAGMEYLNASGAWAACTDTMALADLGWAGDALTVSLRTAGSGDAVASTSVD
ncbi:MAG: LamG-like jellyroll fold domain-containing protein, partial [Bacillota bacterium]